MQNKENLLLAIKAIAKEFAIEYPPDIYIERAIEDYKKKGENINLLNLNIAFTIIDIANSMRRLAPN